MLRFPAWVQFFVSGVMWSVRAPSVALVTSPGKLPLWSCWARYSVVLRLWHGLGLLWLVSLWESSGPASRSAFTVSYEFMSTRELQERRERRAHSRVVLNCPSLDIAHRRLVQSERRYGAEPRLHGFLARQSCIMSKKTFTHVLKLLSGLHIYNITTFVIVLIHTILQPFIKV